MPCSPSCFRTFPGAGATCHGASLGRSPCPVSDLLLAGVQLHALLCPFPSLGTLIKLPWALFAVVNRYDDQAPPTGLFFLSCPVCRRQRHKICLLPPALRGCLIWAQNKREGQGWGMGAGMWTQNFLELQSNCLVRMPTDRGHRLFPAFKP